MVHNCNLFIFAYKIYIYILVEAGQATPLSEIRATCAHFGSPKEWRRCWLWKAAAAGCWASEVWARQARTLSVERCQPARSAHKRAAFARPALAGSLARSLVVRGARALVHCNAGRSGLAAA